MTLKSNFHICKALGTQHLALGTWHTAHIISHLQSPRNTALGTWHLAHGTYKNQSQN